MSFAPTWRRCVRRPTTPQLRVKGDGVETWFSRACRRKIPQTLSGESISRSQENEFVRPSAQTVCRLGSVSQ